MDIQVIEGFSPTENKFSSDAVMDIPGVGIYRGPSDIVE